MYYVDFDKAPSYWYLWQPQIRECNIIGADYATMKDIVSYMYNPSNNFFSALSSLFGTRVQDALKSIRFYPMNLKEWFTMNDATSSVTMGTKAPSVFTTGKVYTFDSASNPTVTKMSSYAIPYVQGIDSFLSYEPYSYIKLYLPFCDHLIDLDCKRVRGRTLAIHFVVDFINGDMIYIISLEKVITQQGITKTYYEVIENVKVHIAMDLDSYNTDYRQMMNNTLNAVNTFGSLNFSGIVNGTLKGTILQDEPKQQTTRGSYDIMSTFCNPLKITLFFFNPITTYDLNDGDYAHVHGIPCQQADILGNFTGFTKIDEIHTCSISGATDTEIEEIENLLKEGVYL